VAWVSLLYTYRGRKTLVKITKTTTIRMPEGRPMPIVIGVIELVTNTLLKLVGLHSQQKQDVAEYLGKIADCLSEFGPAFRKDDAAKMLALAAETRTLAASFSHVVKGMLSESEIEELKPQLETAATNKELLAGSGDAPQQKLDEIAQVAGVFRAFSIILKAGANRLGGS
jgi:hypothetical protein